MRPVISLSEKKFLFKYLMSSPNFGDFIWRFH